MNRAHTHARAAQLELKMSARRSHANREKLLPRWISCLQNLTNFVPPRSLARSLAGAIIVSMEPPSSPLSPARRTRPVSPPPELLTPAGWGHWTGDGLATKAGNLASPRTRYKTLSGGLASPLGKGKTGTSLLDGEGADRTKGIPDGEGAKNWPNRSMKEMADFGTVPSGLPTGISDTEKKLWLAIYVKARETLLSGESDTVRAAVDSAVRSVTAKHSLEFRFAVRWSHSMKTALAMRQEYRASDVYA